MSADPATILVLATVTAVGCLLIFAGYDFAGTILGVIGWVGGGAAGGAAIWYGIPLIGASGSFDTVELLTITVFAVFFGAVFGAVLIRMVTRYTAGITGFLTGAGATLLTLAGRELGATPDEVAEVGVEESPLAVFELFSLSALPQDVLYQTLGIAVIVGIVTGVIAMRNYEELMAVCLTVVGAVLLANTASLWLNVLQGEAVGFAEQDVFSIPVAISAFVVGLVVQYGRHSDRFFNGKRGSPDPLEENA